MNRIENAPDFTKIADTLVSYRSELISYITAFQEYAEEIGLNSVNLTDFPTPVIGGDESFDDDDMYTLDNIERDVEGNVVLCGSSANDNFCEIKLVHLPFDVLCDVAQMLSEYRVRIIGNLLDDAENE